MKYAGWILSLVLLAAVLILWKCPGETATSKADELEQQLKVREAEFKTKDDSTKREIAARDSIIADLKGETEILSGELKVADVKIADLTFRVRHARVIRDTVEYYASCDSLVLVAEAQSAEIKKYIDANETLVFLYNEQLVAMDSMIVTRDELYSKLRTSFTIVADENRNLIKLYEKEKKKHKLAKNASIVLGAAVIILGGILIAN